MRGPPLCYLRALLELSEYVVITSNGGGVSWSWSGTRHSDKQFSCLILTLEGRGRAIVPILNRKAHDGTCFGLAS